MNKDDLTKLAEALENITPWEGFPGAVKGGDKVTEILDAIPERERPTRMGYVLLGYRAALAQQSENTASLERLIELRTQALQARIRELEKALSRYGRHEPSCDCIDTCDCGLDKALNP